MVQLVKDLPTMWETWTRPLGWEDPLEKGKAVHSSVLLTVNGADCPPQKPSPLLPHEHRQCHLVPTLETANCRFYII